MTDRRPNAPDPSHPLLMAARYNDAECQDHGLEGTITKHGLDLDDLIYVAEQRALRLVLIHSGRFNEINPTKATAIVLNSAEQSEVERLIPLYLDAIFLGWRAKEMNGD